MLHLTLSEVVANHKPSLSSACASLTAIRSGQLDEAGFVIYLIELYENMLGMPGLRSVPAFLLRTCNKTAQILRNNSRSCCPCASPSGKLVATSPQGGDSLGLSQTRDAIALRATISKEIQHE